MEQRADLRELLGDIARLPDDQRSALVLAEVGDLSHEEIAAVIEVPTSKVKALVHQARARLIADRDARETPCEDVRELLATARGGELRRGPLRRHLALCEPCSAYRDAVAEQRSKLALVLPVLPSAGLKDTILGALGGGGGGAAATAAGGAALSGGGTTAGLAAKGLGAKLAIGAALAAGAGGGAVVVEQVVSSPPARPAAAVAVARAPAASTPAATHAGAARGSADAVLVDTAGNRASATGRKRRAAAAERREQRARERRAVKLRRAQARRQAKLDRAADKRARVVDREQRKQDRVAAKQQRTAARQERLAARPQRGSSGSAPSATPPKGSPNAAPRSQGPSGAGKPAKAVPAPEPVLEPVVTPGQGKSDAAKGHAVRGHRPLSRQPRRGARVIPLDPPSSGRGREPAPGGTDGRLAHAEPAGTRARSRPDLRSVRRRRPG